MLCLQGTFIDVLSGLFRAVALAVEQDESPIVGTFGAAALLDVVVGLQAECDSQGLRMLQRFVEARRVSQLVNVSGCGTGSGMQAAACAGEPCWQAGCWWRSFALSGSVFGSQPADTNIDRAGFCHRAGYF